MTIWLHKEKKRLYEQVNFASADETRDGVALLCVSRLDGSDLWLPRSDFQEVTFQDVERAYIKLGWAF